MPMFPFHACSLILQRGWPDCPSLRASTEHILIVRGLRAKRMVWLLPPPALRVKKSRAIVPCSLRCVDCVASRFTRFKMPEVPVKIYIDKLLKECSDVTRKLAILSGPVKEKALRAMADRVAADEEKILAANEKDVDAVGKSFEADVMKDRMKAAVARLRTMGTSGRVASQPCPRPDRGDRRRLRTEPAHYGGVDRALLQVG